MGPIGAPGVVTGKRHLDSRGPWPPAPLEQVVANGYIEADCTARDSDLEFLHEKPEFRALISRARDNAANRQTEAETGAP
jgi:hypothetical protein